MNESAATSHLLHRPGPWIILAAAAAIFAWLAFERFSDRALSPEQVEAEYATAIGVWEARGEVARNEVRDRMEPLASLEPEVPGHAGAHAWIATDLLQTAARVSAEAAGEPTASARQHLERAVALDPGFENAYRPLAQLYQRNGEIGKAIGLLTGAVEEMPGLAVLLAFIHDNQGNADLARQHAATGAAHWAEFVATHPEDSMARLRWARAEMLRDNDDKVLEILAAGREQLPADGRFDTFEMGLRQRQANHLLAAEPPRAGDAIEALEQGILLKPKNSRLVSRISAIGREHPEARPRAREALQKLLTEGAPAVSIHLGLGTLSMEDADFEGALVHLERAYAVTPGNVAVVSRLARCLAAVDPPQAERALGLIEGAMKANARAANNPLLLTARGRIRLQQGQTKDGVADLEKALPGLVPQPDELREVYGLLADACEALGQSGRAAIYRGQEEGTVTPPESDAATEAPATGADPDRKRRTMPLPQGK